MRKDILIKRVKEEAKNLKKNATKEELSKLDFYKLDSTKASLCVYGQIANGCYSDRANALIKKCTNRVYNAPGLNPNTAKLNGELKSDFGFQRAATNYFSPIELFIDLQENKELNNKILIDYLQGKRKDLRFIYPKKRG